MLSADSVWDRDYAEPHLIISERLYNLTIGAVLLWGFLVNALMVKMIDPVMIMEAIPNPIVFYVGYLICSVAGIMIYTKSDNPWVSFLGYNMLVVPIGLVLVLVLSMYLGTAEGQNLVLRAMSMTGMVTAGMMFLGGAFPDFFLSLGRILFMALIFGLLAVFGMRFFSPASYQPGMFDGLFVVIFSGYIGYDWARANAIPKTFDNAVDSAASLYLDIINLFLYILRMMSSRD